MDTSCANAPAAPRRICYCPLERLGPRERDEVLNVDVLGPQECDEVLPDRTDEGNDRDAAVLQSDGGLVHILGPLDSVVSCTLSLGGRVSTRGPRQSRARSRPT